MAVQILLPQLSGVLHKWAFKQKLHRKKGGILNRLRGTVASKDHVTSCCVPLTSFLSDSFVSDVTLRVGSKTSDTPAAGSKAPPHGLVFVKILVF